MNIMTCQWEASQSDQCLTLQQELWHYYTHVTAVDDSIAFTVSWLQWCRTASWDS